jgi:hypothetical protein
LEPGKQAVTFIFRHGQRCASRCTREPPAFVNRLKIEFDPGGVIQAESFACNEEVRHIISTCTLTQYMTQVEQGNAQGGAAMLRVPFGPE